MPELIQIDHKEIKPGMIVHFAPEPFSDPFFGGRVKSIRLEPYYRPGDFSKRESERPLRWKTILKTKRRTIKIFDVNWQSIKVFKQGEQGVQSKS